VSPKPMPSCRRRRPPARWAAVALGLLAGLAVLVGPAVLAGTPVGKAAFGSSGCASAADQIHVGLVVDFGTVDGGPNPARDTTEQCLALESGKTGTDLLTAGGFDLSFDTNNGLLCAIGGYPASGVTGCDGTGAYWSYWINDGHSWTYALWGPGSRHPKDASVDGWRFVLGHGTGTDNQPRLGPSPCPPPTTTTTQGPGPVGGGGNPGGGGGGKRPAFHVTPTVKPYTTMPNHVGNSPSSPDQTLVGEALTASQDATTLESLHGSSDTGGGLGNEQASGDPGPGDGNPSARSGRTMLGIGAGLVIVALGVTAVLRFRVKPDA
jgi:hypothetical protein